MGNITDKLRKLTPRVSENITDSPRKLTIGFILVLSVVILMLAFALSSKVTQISEEKEMENDRKMTKESTCSAKGQCDSDLALNAGCAQKYLNLKSIHACCKSIPSYESPKWKLDCYGINRTLSIFTVNGVDYHQYFLTETCEQQNGCTYCSCRQQEVYYTGVYDDGEDHAVAFFKFEGSCKCFNA